MHFHTRVTALVATVVVGCFAQFGDFSPTTETPSVRTPTRDARFSLFVAMGYGFPVGSRHVGESEVTDGQGQGGGNLLEKEDHFLNYGQGIKVAGGLSFRLVERTSAQVEFEFTGGVPRIFEEDRNQTTQVVTNVDRRWNLVGIRTLVVPRFEVFGLLDMYSGVGLGLFFGNSTFEVSRSGGLKAHGTEENAPAPGFLGLFGVDFPVADRVVLFGEMSLEALRITTRKLRITGSNFTGGAYDNDVSNYEDHAEDRQARPRTPGTNVALRAGVRFNLL